MVLYKAYKKNGPVRWKKESVIDAGAHVVKCRRYHKGAPLSVEYENIRLAPQGELTEELLAQSREKSLEEYEKGENSDHEDHPPTEEVTAQLELLLTRCG